jgi:hypothetical protein
MPRATKRARAEKVIRDFIRVNLERSTVSIEEFSGGRAPPATAKHSRRYDGEPHDKGIVAAVFSQLQAEGILGRPYRRAPIPRDRAYPRIFTILRRSA